MKPARLELLLILCLLAVAPAYGNNAARTDEPIRPVPAPSGLDPRKVALGSKLFSDPSLSRDGKIACASCHGLDQGGTDHRRHSIGVGGAEGAINAPSVFNSALNFREFWDGRAASLEAQVDGPLQASAEMGAAWPDVLVRLNRSPGYSAAFAAIYADGVSRENVKNAIAEFERSLVATNSRFDRWLRGDEGAIDAAEKAGYRKFKDFGCVSCHQGANVGGNMFQRMGVMGDYFADRGNVTAVDYGRYNVTHDEADMFAFKVPSLRNVERTAPYFHDGSAATLEEAVKVMARYQLGRELSQQDRDELVRFLKTLTGEYGGRSL